MPNSRQAIQAFSRLPLGPEMHQRAVAGLLALPAAQREEKQVAQAVHDFVLKTSPAELMDVLAFLLARQPRYVAHREHLDLLASNQLSQQIEEAIYG